MCLFVVIVIVRKSFDIGVCVCVSTSPLIPAICVLLLACNDLYGGDIILVTTDLYSEALCKLHPPGFTVSVTVVKPEIFVVTII